MIIGNYTADDSVGETASPSPISPESWCRKDTIRGGRRVDGADACHVSEGESPEGVAVGSSELSRDDALEFIVDMLRSSAGGESSRDDAARSILSLPTVGCPSARRPRSRPRRAPPRCSTASNP